MFPLFLCFRGDLDSEYNDFGVLGSIMIAICVICLVEWLILKASSIIPCFGGDLGDDFIDIDGSRLTPVMISFIRCVGAIFVGCFIGDRVLAKDLGGYFSDVGVLKSILVVISVMWLIWDRSEC